MAGPAPSRLKEKPPPGRTGSGSLSFGCTERVARRHRLLKPRKAIEQMKAIRRWGKARFTVRQSDGTIREIIVQGRDRWALENLIRAGDVGCTPIDHPGPRWSAYAFDLRHEHGLAIDTITERHGPPFDGTHARYVLKSLVSLAEGEMQ